MIKGISSVIRIFAQLIIVSVHFTIQLKRREMAEEENKPDLTLKNHETTTEPFLQFDGNVRFKFMVKQLKPPRVFTRFLKG